jgi:hypothetical protein
LISWVRALTNASRIPHSDFTSRADALGTCTDGRSIRQDLAKDLRIAAVRLRAACADPERSDQHRGHGAHLVSGAASCVRDRKCLRARLDHDATPWPTTQEFGELDGRFAAFVHDRAIARPDTDLGFPSAEIDRTMLHGWLLLMRR